MEIASLSLGIATVGSVFSSCLELYRVIQTIKSLSDDLERQSLFIAIEQQRFLTFGKFLNGPNQDQPGNYGFGNGEAEAMRNVYKQMLTAMESTLKDTKTLMDKYSTIAQPTEIPNCPQGQTQQSLKLQPRKRLSWVINGEKLLEERVKTLRELNNGLSALAPSHIAARLDLDLLVRALGTETGVIQIGQQYAPDNSLQSTLARYRAIRQGYGQLENSPNSTQARLFGGSSYEIQFQEVKAMKGRAAPGERTTALLSRGTEGEYSVLIEWRSRFRTSNDAMARPRLNGLVTILQEMAETNPSAPSLTFGILKCVGWTLPRANAMDSIGFIFQTPRNTTKSPISLYERIRTDIQSKPPKAPALGVRFRLAQKLARIFASMIAVKCIHRGVRSHNVLLFHDEELQDPYLAGFTEARTDAENQLSSLINDNKGDYDLYRPLTDIVPQQSTTSRVSSAEVQHDLYGLGVILLEIGLWRTVDSLRGRAGLRDLHHSVIPQYVEQLSYRTGNYYRDAVRKCLASINQGTDEARLEYAAGVMEQLARCSA